MVVKRFDQRLFFCTCIFPTQWKGKFVRPGFSVKRVSNGTTVTDGGRRELTYLSGRASASDWRDSWGRHVGSIPRQAVSPFAPLSVTTATSLGDRCHTLHTPPPNQTTFPPSPPAPARYTPSPPRFYLALYREGLPTRGGAPEMKS